MLRLIVVLLALANAAFFAWHEGWLHALTGSSPDAGSGQAHLAQQVHPERLIVVGAAPLATAAANSTAGTMASAATNPQVAVASTGEAGVASSEQAPSSNTVAAASVASTSAPTAGTNAGTNASTNASTDADVRCLEAGPFTPDENRTALQQLGKALPKGAWSTQAVSVPGLWLVYMGPYPDAESLQRKLLELRRLKSLNFEEVRSPSNLALGVSLGRFADERQANAALETMRLRGVRTARVVNARPSMELLVQRVPQASLADQAKLTALPLPAGKGFIACAN
jgi:hypothetical protein